MQILICTDFFDIDMFGYSFVLFSWYQYIQIYSFVSISIRMWHSGFHTSIHICCPTGSDSPRNSRSKHWTHRPSDKTSDKLSYKTTKLKDTLKLEPLESLQCTTVESLINFKFLTKTSSSAWWIWLSRRCRLQECVAWEILTSCLVCGSASAPRSL